MAEFENENENVINFFPNKNIGIFTVKFQMNSGSTLEILGFTQKNFLKNIKLNCPKKLRTDRRLLITLNKEKKK